METAQLSNNFNVRFAFIEQLIATITVTEGLTYLAHFVLPYLLI